jgi:hypothetical protein
LFLNDQTSPTLVSASFKVCHLRHLLTEQMAFDDVAARALQAMATIQRHSGVPAMGLQARSEKRLIIGRRCRFFMK